MSINSEMYSSEDGHMLKENSEKSEENPKTPMGSNELENNSQLSLSEESNESFYSNENVNLNCDFKDQHKAEFGSEHLDSALDSESNESDTTTSTTDHRFSETITYQQKIIEQNAEVIRNLEEKCTFSEQTKQEVLSRLEQVRIQTLNSRLCDNI